MMDYLYGAFEIIGTIAFAISGATTGIKKEMDLLGVIVLGMVTAVGGGVLRDVIGNNVPSIFHQPNLLMLALLIPFFIFLIAYVSIDVTKGKYFHFLFTISDSLGLAVFTIFGCEKMLVFYPMHIAVFFGVLTGIGGGLVRDILAGQKPYVLTKHFYASSCIIGGFIYACIHPYTKTFAIFFGVISIFILRMLAAKFKWNLPKIPK